MNIFRDDSTAGRSADFDCFWPAVPGVALSLHPRLYAIAALRGLRTRTPSTTCSEVPQVRRTLNEFVGQWARIYALKTKVGHGLVLVQTRGNHLGSRGA
jgi:hypothetical protein